MFQKIDVESTLTVWSTAKKFTGRPVIICAHGGQSDGYKLMKLPQGVSVNFYCPDGAMYSGMLGNIADRSYEIYETVRGGQMCRDYDLSFDKATDKRLIEGMFQSRLDLAANMKMSGFSEDQVKEFLRGSRDMEMDIVTLRTSRIFSAPSLSKVITMLWRNGWKYTEIHNAHCRFAGNAGKFSAAHKVDLPNGTSSGGGGGLSFTPKRRPAP